MLQLEDIERQTHCFEGVSMLETELCRKTVCSWKLKKNPKNYYWLYGILLRKWLMIDTWVCFAQIRSEQFYLPLHLLFRLSNRCNIMQYKCVWVFWANFISLVELFCIL